MGELADETLDGSAEAQAVKARFNPWWLIGAAVVVLAVVLGLRTLRAPAGDAEIPNLDDPA